VAVRKPIELLQHLHDKSAYSTVGPCPQHLPRRLRASARVMCECTRLHRGHTCTRHTQPGRLPRLSRSDCAPHAPTARATARALRPAEKSPMCQSVVDGDGGWSSPGCPRAPVARPRRATGPLSIRAQSHALPNPFARPEAATLTTPMDAAGSGLGQAVRDGQAQRGISHAADRSALL